jgi:hypothetical protein
VTGAVTIQPNAGTIYAGIPFTFTVQGGRTPYALTSSEPGLLQVPNQIDGHSFTVVAANPGVIDPSTTTGSLPVKTVTISVRSGDGISTSTSGIKVGQNFLTGYGISFSPITCPISLGSGGTTTPQACAGGESTVTMSATFNGNLAGDRQFQFQVLKGHFSFVFPQGGTGNSVTTVSDHSGNITVIIQAQGNIPSEVAVLRVIDVATGVYDDHAFIITGTGGTGTLTAIPSTITFTGIQTTDCGGGAATFLVLGGIPPYSAISTVQRAVLRNTTSNTNPGQFTFDMSASSLPCQFGPIVVQDSTGANTQVQVTAQPGATAPPTPAAFTVLPAAITLGCGQSGSVTAIGGSGSYFTNSTTPNITAVVAGNTVTITRLNSGTTTGTDTVTVSDGANVAPVVVTDTATCP